MTLINKLNKFSRDESGATAIEYGLIAGLIAVAVITIMITLGPQVSGMFQDVSTELTKAGA